MPAPASASPARANGAMRLAAALALAAAALALAGLAAGAEGWSLAWREEGPLVAGIRAPRTLGALLAGACLGLAGAIAQGLFRNPL
ncbi:MAG: iron chelate uptake ABC transporter family permease subunit, partial [Burkholderiales bacterium]